MKNNKSQSLISVMLFVMVLGIIVTLIIASSITDTKRLVAQKSYERAYSLSDSYMSKILANSGVVFGAFDSTKNNDLSNIVDSSNSPYCKYEPGSLAIDPVTNPSNQYKLVTFTCKNSGPNKDSHVQCTQQPTNFGLSMTGVKDKKLKINLDAIESRTTPKLAFIFSNAEALLFNFTYTKDNGVSYQNYVFGIRRNDVNGVSTGYGGMVSILPNNGDISFQDVKTDPVVGQQIINTLVVKQTISSDIAANIQDAFLSSIEGDSYSFTLDIKQLASRVYLQDGQVGVGKMKSLYVTFLNRTYVNAKYSVYQVDFGDPLVPSPLSTQFQRTSCKALDSAESASGLISGFGAAELETYKPINKTVAGILDYSLYIGRENNPNSTNVIDNGLGSSIYK